MSPGIEYYEFLFAIQQLRGKRSSPYAISAVTWTRSLAGSGSACRLSWNHTTLSHDKERSQVPSMFLGIMKSHLLKHHKPADHKLLDMVFGVHVPSLKKPFRG